MDTPEEGDTESMFDEVKVAKTSEANTISRRFYEDAYPHKVNLAIDSYRTDDGKPWILPVVHTIEAQMSIDKTLNHEYLPEPGMPDYREATVMLALGTDSPAVQQGRADGVQTIGSTSGINLGLEFLRKHLQYDTVYLSDPCEDRYRRIAEYLGYSNIKSYRYWDDTNRWLNIDELLEDLRNASDRSVVILQASAHAPTGVDPSPEQWEQILQVVQEKKLFPFFVNSYQGLATDTFDKDVASIRLFDKAGMELFVAQSYAANFGLYGEKPGSLVYVTGSRDSLMAVRSQIENLAHVHWGSPPAHGVRVVATVLQNPAFYSDWRDHVRAMSTRIRSTRSLLHEKLRALGTPGTWDHLVRQTGLFSYTGLTSDQCDRLTSDHHVYLPRDGRINICGVTSNNIDQVVNSIHDVCMNT